MKQARACAFGLIWQADISLDQFAPCRDDLLPADVIIRETSELAEREHVAAINRGFVYKDGFRFGWDGEVVVDMVGGNQISYYPGPGWGGALPPSFYSTVAALTMAWRGAIPFHACAVELEGKAILICGATGQGKSTLAAALVSHGARFIGDDLSVVDWCDDQGCFVVQPGRATIRLYPSTAAWLNPVRIEHVPDDPRGKVLAFPAPASSVKATPLAGLLRLGTRIDPVPLAVHAAVLGAQLFRPNWLSQLPGNPAMQQKLRALAVTTRIVRMRSNPVSDKATGDDLALRALAIITGHILH
jgi:hypothetical protein